MKSMSLFEIQKNFLASLVSTETPEGLTPESRFKVYSTAFRARLTDSLEEDFPETLKLLENSDVLDDYVDEVPSDCWNLAEYSRNFPEYLKKNFPEKADVFLRARIEWAKCMVWAIGDHLSFEAAVPERPFYLVINPSLLLVDHMAIFIFKGTIKELSIDPELPELIRLSSQQMSFEQIETRLHLDPEKLPQILGQWSSEGLILGLGKV